MNRLVIIGAGGFGREILAWAKASLSDREIRGFIDDNPSAAQDDRLRAPVIASVEAYEPRRDDVFVCAVGKPYLRRTLSEKIRNRGGRFVTLVHPSAIVVESATLGDGTIICPYALVSCDAHIGEGVTVYYQTSIDHDARVGRWSQISAHCDVAGEADLGDEIFMGSHATILPRVHVGNRAIVAAGAVVIRDVPDSMTVGGVPAHPLHQR